MAPTGTHDLHDLLNYNNVIAEQYGYDNLNEVISRELSAVNAATTAALALFATDTTEREEGAPTGGNPRMVMIDPDYARSRTQRGMSAGKRGYPLHALEYAAGFTAMYLRQASVAEIARTTLNARLAYVGALRDGVMRAFFTPTNYTFQDYVTPDRMPVQVKALANGDGEVPPITAAGKRFTASHNHYLAGPLTAENADRLVKEVTEHYEGNRIVVYVSADDEAAWRGLSGFLPYLPASIVAGQNQAQAVGTLDITQTDDRPIGVLPNGAVVHTKPWVPHGYALAINVNAPKPLRRRLHKNPAMQGLFLNAENIAAPLQAQAFAAFFGFGVAERWAAAVHYFGPDHASGYRAPKFSEWADDEGSGLA